MKIFVFLFYGTLLNLWRTQEIIIELDG